MMKITRRCTIYLLLIGSLAVSLTKSTIITVARQPLNSYQQMYSSPYSNSHNSYHFQNRPLHESYQNLYKHKNSQSHHGFNTPQPSTASFNRAPAHTKTPSRRHLDSLHSRTTNGYSQGLSRNGVHVSNHLNPTVVSDSKNLRPFYRRDGNYHHISIPLRNNKAQFRIPPSHHGPSIDNSMNHGQFNVRKASFSHSEHNQLENNIIESREENFVSEHRQPHNSRSYRFKLPLGRKYHSLTTSSSFGSHEGNSIDNGYSNQDTVFRMHLSQTPSRPLYSNHTQASQQLLERHRNLEFASVLPSGCIRCPPDQVLIIEKGKGCVEVRLPPIKACSGLSRSPGAVEVALDFGPKPGSAIAEGNYLMQLHILKSSMKVRTCQFTLHVQVKKCPDLLPSEHLFMQCSNGTAWGSVCHFVCLNGYTLVGNNAILCEGDTTSVKWSAVPPTCQELRNLPLKSSECTIPFEPQNGFVHCQPETSNGMYPSGATCRYLCHVGYRIPEELLQKDFIMCRDSVWNSTDDIQCVPYHCTKPREPVNGYFQCNNSHKANNLSDTPANGHSNYVNGTTCQYHCNDGYVIPTSQLDRASVECKAPIWNSSQDVECKKAVLPSSSDEDCSDIILTTEEDGFATLANPRFNISSGELVEAACTYSGRLQSGNYDNFCEAADEELRVTASCQYMVMVVVPECGSPSPIEHGNVSCNNPGSNAFPISTICQYECHEGYVIPTSQLERRFIQCERNLAWNITESPLCTKRLVPEPEPNTCSDVEFVTSDPKSIVLKLPKFLIHDGSPAEVTCTVYNVTHHGKYENYCEGKDLELRSTSACKYSITVKDIDHTEPVKRHSCDPLTAPANGKIRCRSRGGKFRCHIKCREGTNFLSSYSLLRRGYVECDTHQGIWDFQREHNLTNLPDCLRELPTTLLQAPLNFKTGVDNCSDYVYLDKVMTALREGLQSRNNDLCERVQCHDIVFMCAEDMGSKNASLDTTLTVQAFYQPDDYEYGEDVPDVESTIEKVQTNTENIVTDDKTFKNEVESAGANLWEDSFKKGQFELVCQKPGYVLDQDTSRCFECPTGAYEEEGNCEKCPKNFFQDQTGQTKCKPCPRGTLSPVGSRLKSNCQSVGRPQELSLPDPVREQALTESSLINSCDSNPCINGGTCIIVRNSYRCLCKEGYKGKQCEMAFCPENMCLNGGSCSLYITGVLGCLCPPHTTGSRCESRLAKENGPCVPNPCENGGKCSANQSDFTCSCTAQYTGDHCEYRTCNSGYRKWYCLNGGTCGIMPENQSIVCICPRNFMGTRCEYPEALMKSFQRKGISVRSVPKNKKIP